MDGNGRWAEERGLSRSAGHQAGYQAARRMIAACGEMGVNILTLFAFSSENWLRPATEIDQIMNLLYQALTEEIHELHEKKVRFKVIGDLSRLSPEVQKNIINDHALTVDNQGLTLILAVNYGGRWDILEATKRLIQRVQSGQLTVNELNSTVFANELSTAGFPDPDLLIRASGEQRISNFLNWQLAYTELYFTDTYWPDFDSKTLATAIEFYQSRERRFGLTGAQVRGYTGESLC
jgi:undecaprenyl diphosphate synthase